MKEDHEKQNVILFAGVPRCGMSSGDQHSFRSQYTAISCLRFLQPASSRRTAPTTALQYVRVVRLRHYEQLVMAVSFTVFVLETNIPSSNLGRTQFDMNPVFSLSTIP